MNLMYMQSKIKCQYLSAQDSKLEFALRLSMIMYIY